MGGKISLFLARIDNYKVANPSAYKKVLYKLKFAISVMQKKSEAKRLAMFLEYIKKHDIPNHFSNVRWVDLDKSCRDKSLVSTWFFSNIQEDKFNLFMRQVENCVGKDNFVYKKINNAVKCNFQKGSNFVNYDKLAIFMKYIENNPIPITYSDVRWCDIYEQAVNNSMVCFWFSYNLQPNLIDSFFEKVKKYKKIYPNAYLKIEKIILERKDKRTDDYTNRKMEAFFKYIDKALDVDIDKSMERFEIIHFNNLNDDLISRIKSTSMCNGGRPVVVAGTYDESYFDEDLYKAGMKAYVTEPVFLSDIKKIEQKILEPGSDENTGNDIVQYDFTGRRILVVDDNDINADIAVDYLEDVNAQCDTASNGQEAYNLIAGGAVYDLILMDVRMPVMNGYDATRAIRNLKTDYALNVPIVAMTANAFKEDIDATYECGMNDHITKPMSSDALYSILYRLLS